MEIQGHRGFGKLAPFNSIRAFNLASRLGLDSVEFDIRILKDKTLVVSHGKDFFLKYNIKKIPILLALLLGII